MKLQNVWMISLLALTFVPPSASAAMFISEFLADPPNGLAGDANRDGTRSSIADEFIELMNGGDQSQDLSQWSLWDSSSLRHLFATGISIPAQNRLVVFGGGNPQGIPGLVLTSSTGNLSLNNTADQIFLKNNLGAIIDQLTYGNEGNQDQSLARYPEAGGVFKLHSQISQEGLPFSPGTDPDGKWDEKIPSAPEPTTLWLLASGLFGLWSFKTARLRRRFNIGV